MKLESSPRRSKAAIALSAAASAIVLSACGSGSAASGSNNVTATTSSPPISSIGGTVRVAYAGSLVGAMVNDIGPAFEKATGISFSGVPGGSTGLVNQIKTAPSQFDVFISAAKKANDPLMGSANGNLENWYITMGSSPLVVGYSPSSPFASQFKSSKWYQVMQQPGIKIGRTDPATDPKGALTEKLLAQEAVALSQPNLATTILGPVENPAQVFPEQTLVARLQAGQLDAGFFYTNEAVLAHIPYVSTGLDLGASFTISILSSAADKAQAVSFVNFIYSAAGQALLKKVGVTPAPAIVTGNLAAGPAGVQIAQS
ncbi:MAG: extracellular solute-binding protein [Actinomycetota bacterium]|nr:extracellular solute-binding protein [Actinomycetota bacterium]